MKKIFSSIILSALVIGMFLRPVSVYAYSTDLNSYIDPDLSVEDAKEYVAQTILAYALATGAELVVPGSGATVAEITDKVWDVIDFTDELYSWALQTKRKMQDGYLPWEDVTYNLSPGSAYSNSPIYLGWTKLKENWNNEQEDIPTYPETNYLPYIELINGKSFNYQYNLTDNWITTISSSTDHISGYSLNGSGADYSFFNKNWNNNTQFNNSSYKGYYVAVFDNNLYKLYESYTLEHVSIYINRVNNQYQITTSTLTPKAFLHGNSYGNSYTCGLNYDRSQNKITGFTGRTTSVPTLVTFSANKNTLEECFQLIAMRWRNVNIYVDGIPWSIITEPPDPIQLGGNTYITDTDTPVYYDFPDGTLFDPNAFAAIMRQLIDLNNTGNAITIQLDDVLESFTDEYGVTAQYVVNIVRNDYDNLLSEQYGNKQVRVQFPEELKPYSEKVTYVMNNFGDDLIPQDLLTIICCGGILLLIGFLINRMLE